MNYNGYTGSTAARPFRVIIGGLMAFACLYTGPLFVTYQYHRALTMKETPLETDWDGLVIDGITDNTFVRLIDVDVQFENNEIDLEKFLEQHDPDSEDFEGELEDFDAFEMIDFVYNVKVFPRGENPNEVSRSIVIPNNEWALSEAKRQLEESGTLTGYVSTTSGEEFYNAIMLLAGYEVAEEEKEDGIGGEMMVLQPMSAPFDRAQAASTFWFCGFGFALGLIICGSGGPTIRTCIFFWWCSVLSLIGYPMRYGRGGMLTRAIYIGTGAMCIGYGYKTMCIDGHFGTPDGNPLLHSVGFIAFFFGAAGILSVPAQILSRKFEASLDVQPTKKKEPKISVQDACSLEPVEKSSDYVEAQLTTTLGNIQHDVINQHCEQLQQIGFGAPEQLGWCKDGQNHATGIQTGCQEMVLVDIEQIGDSTQCRLVSVLYDGLPVISLSSNIRAGSERRMGSNGIYFQSRSSNPAEMLSQHLEETIALAERRDTAVVTFEPGEAKNVCLFARRALADVKSQYGENLLEVSGARYGRFAFPLQPVEANSLV